MNTKLGDLEIRATIDFADAIKLSTGICSRDVQNDQKFYINRSCYKIGEEYRFIRYHSDSVHRIFYLSSVGGTSFVENLIGVFSTPLTYDDAIQYLGNYDEHPDFLLQQLLTQQILFSTADPNITGVHFFSRLGTNSGGLYSEISQIKSIACLKQFKKRYSSDYRLNIISKKDTGTESGIDAKYQSYIWEGLKINQILSPGIRSIEALERFADEFSGRFENECIPLLKALDPEIGIDYGNLAREFSSSMLSEEGRFESKKKDRDTTIEWNEPLTHILNEWVKTGFSKNQPIVQLHSEELMNAYGEKHSIISPSLSVFFRICNNGKLFIENIGGPSGSSVIGRFTPFDDRVAEIQKKIALAEQNYNPDSIFAEILHIDDYKVANVDQRNRGRDYEIPVLTTSLADQSCQIQLSDIWVQIANNEVVLWSKKLNKRILPRLSSAYNHSKSSLAIYRFLCDLQYQGLSIPAPFNMSSVLPGLKFYPRLETDNVVIHLAEWTIEEEEFTRRLNSNSPNSDRGQALRIYLNDMGIPEVFTFSEADKQLLFYRDRDSCIFLLLDILMKKKTMVLKEYPFSGGECYSVTDSFLNRYSAQFIAFLIDKNSVNDNIYIKPDLEKTGNVKRKYIPGDTCVYLKIYCHQSFSNHLITNIVDSFIRMCNEKKAKIDKWFFVRYFDPCSHIRFRFFCEEPQQIELLSSFKNYIQPLLAEGRVADISWATYSREIERYSSEKIDTVESIFCKSSNWVARFLNFHSAEPTIFHQYEFAFMSTCRMVSAAGLDRKEKTDLHRIVFEGIHRKLNLDASSYKSIQKRYRELHSAGLFNNIHIHACTTKCGDDLLQDIKDIIDRNLQKDKNLLIDIIHLHLNRILNNDILYHEMIIHYCLWRYHLSEEKKRWPLQCINE